MRRQRHDGIRVDGRPEPAKVDDRVIFKLNGFTLKRENETRSNMSASAGK